jgi:hypothetical protein
MMCGIGVVVDFLFNTAFHRGPSIHQVSIIYIITLDDWNSGKRGREKKYQKNIGTTYYKRRIKEFISREIRKVRNGWV